MTIEQMVAKLRGPIAKLCENDVHQAADLIEQQAAEIARKDAALTAIADDPYPFGQRVQAFKRTARQALGDHMEGQDNDA